MMKSRFSQSNPEDSLQGKLVENLFQNNSQYSRIFYYGQVINNVDPQNLNRIKVRIPVLDDIFYTNQTKDLGDSRLPWCLPMSSRFLESPEQNSIVVVAIFDPKVPYFGRMFFDAVTMLSSTNLFEILTPEEKSLSNWLNADNAVQVNNPKPDKNNEYEVSNKIAYTLGIRGKGKNKLQFNETQTLLTQFHKDKDKESFLLLDQTISKLEAADQLHLHSKKGDKNEYNVVFDKKLFDYLDKVNKMIGKLVIQFNSIPGISPNGPCTPAGNAGKLVSEFSSLKSEMKKFRKDGSSDKIWVN